MNRINLIRLYGSSILRRGMCNKPSIPPPPQPDEANSVKSMTPKYRPSEFQKYILVLTKKYKSKDEIPKYVSPEIIDRARSEARIKLANILMLLTALASFGAILSGKAAAKRGESVHQMNLDWHKQYQEDYKQNNEAQK